MKAVKKWTILGLRQKAVLLRHPRAKTQNSEDEKDRLTSYFVREARDDARTSFVGEVGVSPL